MKRKLLALAIAQGIATAGQAVTITVDFGADTTANDGLCTLREAVVSANTDPASEPPPGECAAGSGDDLIQFDPALFDQTITLSAAGAAGQIAITSSLTLQGPGADRLTVSGNDNSRIFDLSAAADVIIDGLTLVDGRAGFGGAISNAGRLRLQDSVISSSNADDSGGGAISTTGANLTVTGSTLSGNTALLRGGAIDAAGETNVYSSTISSNRAGLGGGAYVNGATLRLTHTTLARNTGTTGGGGVRVNATGTLRMTSTIVADSAGGDCSLSGTLGTNTANLVEDGSCSAQITGDPALGALADNGGPTPTHALTPGSIAIDPSNSACLGPVDQRGATRPVDGDGNGVARCDTGAFEFIPAIIVDTLALTAADGDCALPEAVENANNDAATHADCTPGFQADTITFDPTILPGTITLAGSQMTIDSALTVQGPGADQLTISGGDASRIFQIDDSNGPLRQPVTLSGMTLTGGSAGGGGAISNNENLTVDGVTLTGNTATAGGAILNSLQGVLSLSQSKVSGNGAASTGGGLHNLGTATVTGTTLSGNTATRGGGVYNDYAGPRITLINSTLSGNTASMEGGGLWNAIFATATLTNTTVSGNAAAMEGGGLWNEDDATVTLLNGTVADNSATQGGGIFARYGTIDLTNSIVSGNAGGDCDNQGSISTSLANWIEDGSCSPDFSGDPMLGQLRDNAGPTFTHLPLPGSPAIDAGDAGACPGEDQRGFARPADGDNDGAPGCDLGASEVPPSLEVTSTAIAQSSDGLCSLPEAIANANADSQILTGSGECPPGFGPDRIIFDPAILPATITLAGTPLTISSDVTIQGPSADQLTVSGADASRVFHLNDGVAGASSEVRLNSITVADGFAPGFSAGGAVYNREKLFIDQSALTGNSAEYGGAIASDGSVTITTSTLSGNSAVRGGAILNAGGEVTLRDSTLSANSASFAGGGVYSRGSATVTVTNSTLSGNDGGSFGGALIVTGTTTATMSNSTVFGNTANNTGGVFNERQITLYNTVIAGSIGGDDCYTGGGGSALIHVNTLIEDGTCSPTLSGDPRLDPLADNGGPTQTHAVLSLSPLTDAGDNVGCPDTDQTGMLRPIDGDGDSVAVCDIGAFEFVDLFGPQAAIARAPDVTAAGGTSYALLIDYLDDAPVDQAQLDGGDITVAGPGGALAVVMVGAAGNRVTYTLTPPGGAWGIADNGSYSIDLNPNEVFDTATTGANAAAAALLGAFVVAIGSNAPVVQDAMFTVQRNSANGTVVGQVQATDADNDIPATGAWQITAGNDAGAYGISDDGTINVADATQLVSTALTVVVSDALGLSDSAAVTITVLDELIFASGFENLAPPPP